MKKHWKKKNNISFQYKLPSALVCICQPSDYLSKSGRSIQMSEISGLCINGIVQLSHSG